MFLLFRQKSYKSQEFFWSDLGFAMGIEAVGKIDSSLETVGIYTTGRVETILQSLQSKTEYAIYS